MLEIYDGFPNLSSSFVRKPFAAVNWGLEKFASPVIYGFYWLLSVDNFDMRDLFVVVL